MILLYSAPPKKNYLMHTWEGSKRYIRLGASAVLQRKLKRYLLKSLSLPFKECKICPT